MDPSSSNNVTEGGGAIASVIVGFTMTNTLMHDNSGADGGAIMCNASNTTITNCTIVGNNDTQLTGLNSSAILVHTGNTSFTILNSIIWDNVINFDDYDGGTLNISYSDIEGGESGILLSDNNTGTLNWGEGNLNVNPLFCDLDTDNYTIYELSPCANTSSNESVYKRVSKFSPSYVYSKTKNLDC